MHTTTKFPKAAQADRAADLIDAVWSQIPAELTTDEAMRVAQAAFDILATPSDAEFTAMVARVLHLGLALGLVATISYALLHDVRLAWLGAALYAGSAVIYVLYLVVVTE